MLPDRRRLIAAVAALLLTIGSGLLVGGALMQRAPLTALGALLLVSGTAVLASSLLSVGANPTASPVREPGVTADGGLFERLADPVLLLDRQGTVRRASASVARLAGYAPAALTGQSLGRLLHEDDAALLDGFLQDVSGGVDVPVTRWRFRRADGGWLACQATATSLLDEPAIGAIAIVLREDVQAATMADPPTDPLLYDPLTGLTGAALFRDRVAHALARARRQQAPLCVVQLEFDEFRAGGERCTYEELERLLAAAATRITTSLRASDSAARLEGTRFGFLLEDVAEERHFAQVSERLARLFATPLVVNGQEFIASGNIGIATATPDDGADELLRNADVALRAARRRGRGAVELYDPQRTRRPSGTSTSARTSAAPSNRAR